MGRFLTDVSPFAHIPPVAGVFEYVHRDGVTVTLGLLQGYRENQGSGWTYTIDYLHRYFESCLAEDAGQARAESNTSPHAGYLALVRTLARRTAELHAALARVTGDSDFDPEPASPEDPATWKRKVHDDAVSTLDQLEARRAGLAESLRPAAGSLLDSRVRLMDHIESLALASPSAMKTRYHGNYHLGQVLVAQDDFIITDFEGEPERPIAERRIKHSPLRDVAGMVRSFGYAASVALDQFTATRPSDRALLGPFAKAWETDTVAAFLEAYREAAAGCPSYPAEARDAERLLRLFELEKALYEVRYEIDNRPELLPIPLHGLLRLVHGLEGGAT
jgi:maltose alpha-D-glucosyltransferase / alpha-amylase